MTRWRPVWRMGLRLSVPLLPLLTLAGVALALLVPDVRERAVTLIVPLAAGAQAALLFAPEDEPALEILLAAPRPPWWIVLERLLPLIALQGAVGLLGSLALAVIWGAPVGPVLLDWTAPAALLIALGLLLTFVTRRSAAGALGVLLLGGGLLIGGDGLAARVPAFTLLHPYLIPPVADVLAVPLGLEGATVYALNRLLLPGVAVLLIARVLAGLRDADAVLGAGRPRSD